MNESVERVELSEGTLNVTEFDIDLLDTGDEAGAAPTMTTITTSSLACITVTAISYSLTEYYDCI